MLQELKPSFIAGVKIAREYIASFLFRGWIELIGAVLLAGIWHTYAPQHDFLTYFLIIFFLVWDPFTFIYYMCKEYENLARTGWHVFLGKGRALFLPIAMIGLGTTVGERALPIGVVSAFLVLTHKLTLQHLMVLLLYDIVLLLFSLCFAYFLSGFAFFFYSIWGIRVLARLTSNILGGVVVPFLLISPTFAKLFALLPFYHLHYGGVIVARTGQIPLFSLLILGIWGVIFFLLGLGLHRIGYRYLFEAQGG